MKTALHNASPGSSLARWLLRAWKQRGGLTTRDERKLRVEETLSLGGRRQVHLVRCGDERFLIGCGSDSVSCITALNTAQPQAEEQA